MTETKFALLCHPATPDPAVDGIAVCLRRAETGLAVAYRLDGRLAALRVPASGAPLPVERLWAFTCFELFVAGAEEAAYREFNFSPSGQWMRFDFAGYRQRVPSPDGPAPRIDVRQDAGGLELTARLPLELLPSGALRVGLTAVVEHADGGHRYWALSHPAAQPDFHHRDGFAAALKAATP